MFEYKVLQSENEIARFFQTFKDQISYIQCATFSLSHIPFFKLYSLHKSGLFE